MPLSRYAGMQLPATRHSEPHRASTPAAWQWCHPATAGPPCPECATASPRSVSCRTEGDADSKFAPWILQHTHHDFGPPGVGKTHLAIGLGMVAAETGHRLTFLSALELARRMNTAFAQNRLPHYLKTLTTPRLLIIDEVGYLGLDAQQASMLFQVICSRYEKQAATIITSNKPFSEWGHVFAGDPVMASAALDRLLHRATVVNIKGDSYRLKEKRQAGLFSGAAALDPTKGGATTKTK